MAEFKTIHTTYGLIAMAQAEATGTPINLTHMAVGDGNGNAVTPVEGMTNMVRERFRAGRLMFALKYLWWTLRHGYFMNPYEIEARAAESKSP